MKKTILMGALMAVLSASALAAEGFYAGAAVGSVRATGGTLTKSSDTGYSLVGGYQENKYLAGEVTYTNLGRTANGAVSAKNTVYSVAAVGFLPVADKLSAVGKLGYASSKTDVSTGVSARQNGVLLGVGAQYEYSPQVAVRASMDRTELGDTVTGRFHENYYSATALYRF